ncbi:MAG: sulfurtransferase complex subunit TusB [Nitrospirae bacterium]|nr:sulfurtransferase complex subunit TusB [Nitrospirota bacterium]
MKLAVFVSDYRLTADTLERLTSDKLGIIFVSNGVYHATIKEKGNSSALLKKNAQFYVLHDDLETRGLGGSDIAENVKLVSYGELVELIFNDYEKLAWL